MSCASLGPETTTRRRAVFLERDRMLIDNVPCNADPVRVTLAHGASGALRELKTHGLLVVVVSSQPGVALGRISLEGLESARDLDVDLTQSWLIGDTLDDIEAGNRASCPTVLVHTGNETEWRLGSHRQPQHVASSLRLAARLVLTPGNRSPGGPDGHDDAFDVAS